jgi:phage head maturation protease
MPDDFKLFLPISKVEKQNDGSVTISGYASTPALDLDGEIVSLDAVKKALPGYMAWRNIREMHQPRAVGVAKEANVDEKGLFLTSKIVDKAAVEKVLEGVYKGYSIGGRKLAKTGNTITEIDLVEISIVDRPANPECPFSIAKSAKAFTDSTVGYLVKTASPPRDPKARALGQMAKAVRTLAKAPPAAHDGLSLPAPMKCAAHGLLDCKKCMKAAKKAMKKRDVSEQERSRLASSGAALPDGSFPIANRSDLANARQAVGRAKDPSKARAHIKARAEALGVALPDNWKKKQATALIKSAEDSLLKLDPSPASELSFLTLDAGEKPRRDGASLGKRRSGHESMLEVDLDLQKGGNGADEDFLDLKFVQPSEDRTMTVQGDALTKWLIENGMADVVQKARQGSPMTRAARMADARGNLKKVKKARGGAAAAIEEAHKVLKAAYLAKQALVKAGKKPPMDDDGDFDMGKVMGSLQKAFGELTTMKTFIKAADGQLKKAASRAGQRGQEVSDGNEHYQVPAGVKDLSQSDLTSAGPGSGRGSEPPMYPVDGGVYPGKSAKSKGMISVDHAEAIAKAAAAEAKVELLERAPVGPTGRRPYSFDVTKAFSGNGKNASSNNEATKTLFDGVDPAALMSGDEHAHTAATARVIGNMLTHPSTFGKSVLFDPNFKGGAGFKAQNS